MATYYWVGGTGTWTSSSTTNWASSSGGAGGAGVPGTGDSVIFNSASNATAYTVTISTGAVCSSITVAGPASGNVTFSGSAAWSVYGSFTLPSSGITWSYIGSLTFASTATGNTITTNGISLGGATIVFNGAGGGWTLGSAFTSTTSVTFINGTFNTGNFSCTNSSWGNSGSGTNAISLGSSTITCSGTNGWNFSSTTGLTFSSGTSTLSFSNSGTFASGGLTYNNVNFTNTGAVSNTITGTNTFANLTFSTTASTGVRSILFQGNQTITGTFTANGGAYNQRIFIQSSTLGTPYTITAATVSAAYCDFRDITGAGAGTWSGTSFGNCGGNSGITFTTAKTVYWNLTGSQNWSATGWATTSGGTPAAANFPLTQDTAIIDQNSAITTLTIDAAWNIGTFDAHLRTSAMTLATGTTTPTIYGNWSNGTGTTLSGTGIVTFAGRGSQTITSAGVTFTQPITINSPNGSVTLQDAFSSSATGNALQPAWGTFNANGYNVTLTGSNSTVLTSTSNTRTVAIGSGTWTLGGTGGWNASTSTGLTITGTGTISLTSASAKSFQGGSVSYSGITLNQGGAGALTITGSNTFGNITASYISTGATTITFTAGTTQTVANWTATGNATNTLTINSSTSGTAANLSYTGSPVISVDYLSIKDSHATPSTLKWYAGTHSTNVSGNTGWIFPSPSNFFNFFPM